ncbi:MAG: response regulator [Spirochaetales bacterium]|nr:MAG: response regulator [Spirochaetales bacterium]
MAKSSKRVRIFSALEVANLCGVVNQTAINWIRNGYLKAFTTPGGQYRVYAEDLFAFLENRGMRVPAELADTENPDVDWACLLIVDDDRALNDLAKRYFEKSDLSFTIYQAYDGFEAGAVVAEKRPGFIVLDIDLPGIDGNKICRKIKTDPHFGKPFIVAITGLEEVSAKERILASGADAFMPKPLDFQALVAQVADFAGKVRNVDGK